jgi:hypothetical protein
VPLRAADVSGAARHVGVVAQVWAHAVWVPHDLPTPKHDVVPRDELAPLVLVAFWRGRAACGQVVSGVIAGPQGGHDWQRVETRQQCPRCVRALAAEDSAGCTS